MNFGQIEQLNKTQQDEIEKGFDFLKKIEIKSRNVKERYITRQYFFRYLKILPLFLLLALFFVFNVDSSGGKTIVSELQGVWKYFFAAGTVFILFTVFALLAAMMFPSIIHCEFEDENYKIRLATNSSDAISLMKIVKTPENLKTMSAMIKGSMDNSNEKSIVMLTVIASIGIFTATFPILIGLKLLDGGVLAPMVGLAGIFLLNTLRLELASQNLKRRIWVLVIETAQNLKSEEKNIILPNQNILIYLPNAETFVQSIRFSFNRFNKKISAE